MNMVHSWSYSTLMNFEKCPHSVTFPYRAIDNEHTTRGTDIHNSIEAYINDPTTECPYPALQANFDALRIPNTSFVVEAKWGFNREWQPVEYKGSWLKIKPDLVVTNGETVKVVDFKSGKRYGNELKHGQQVQLYTCAAAIMNPEVTTFVNELWYVDHGLVISSMVYNRAKVDGMRDRWHKRGMLMTLSDKFPAKPSKSNCKYCFERDRCEFAYEE
jgi:CRISPR/Cas system-associated exonuclease Cas4 (RecB family)